MDRTTRPLAEHKYAVSAAQTGLLLALLALTGFFSACQSQDNSSAPPQSPTSESIPAPDNETPSVGSEVADAAAPANGQEDLPEFPNLEVPVDQFNPWPEGKKLVPKPGGELIIRTPGDPQTLNPLLIRGEMAGEISAYLTDRLITVDPETLEVLPLMAWKFEVRDQVTLNTLETVEGIVLSEDDETVTILENAGRITIGKNDLEAYDVKQGTLTTKDGDELTGTITEYQYTVIIENESDAEEREIKKEKIIDWTDPLAGQYDSRKAIKERVIKYFTLREQLKWQDGAPLNAEDFKLGLDLVNNPFVDAAQLRHMYLEISKSEVEDDYTIKFTYRKPYFQALTNLGELDPVPKHIFDPKKYQYDDQGLGEFFNKHPSYHPSSEAGRSGLISCGPYKLKHWLLGKEVVVERNPNYWAKNYDIPYAPKDQPYLDRITWSVINNKTAALKELQKGAVHADFDVEPDTWLREDTNSDTFNQSICRANTINPLFTYIGWNMKKDLFKSAKVRQALTMLIPRNKILNDIHYGLGRIVTGPLFIDSPAYDQSLKPYEENLTQARRLLRSEGWIDRDGDGIIEKDGQPFEFEYLIHNARDYHQKIADIIKESVERAGIRVTIRKLDWSVFMELVNDHEFDAVRLAWEAKIDPDPYQIWHSTQSKDRGSNHVSYDNPQVDNIIEVNREEFDPQKRWDRLRKMHRIIYEEQPYTFLFCFDSLTFYSRKFYNVKFYKSAMLLRARYGRDLTQWCLNHQWE